jgi:hypothetical protein
MQTKLMIAAVALMAAANTAHAAEVTTSTYECGYSGGDLHSCVYKSTGYKSVTTCNRFGLGNCVTETTREKPPQPARQTIEHGVKVIRPQN